ncbi:MAG: cation:proton antiporter [Leptolyngbya sp. SIO4C1]|nr:cation:proton antiporter [Leptolyngbya sp. SIO4C1]
MSQLTIVWIALPFLLGFSSYLFPKLNRYLAIGAAIASALYAGLLFHSDPVVLRLLDHFGVTLVADRLSGYFVLTNALVTTAVALYCWSSSRSPFFYTQIVILHGSVNSAFICADLISLYVALEVISIAAFLLIAYPRSDRAVWVGLRYLFVSNTAMLFYLMGAVLVYQAHRSFAYAGLRSAPTEALALVCLGLLVKGGVFVSGLWLPLTHAESETPVSALLSGVVVKAGIFPLLRCALMLEDLSLVISLLGLGTALLGVGYALFEQDAKRLLALSTISQMGFVLAVPAVGGLYALTHGLAKSALFLLSGTLPSRNLRTSQPMPTKLWAAIAVAGLSISGLPLLSGFAAKVLTLKQALPWQAAALNVAAVGTAAVMAKLLFLPHRPAASAKPQTAQLGFWAAIALLLGGLIAASGIYPTAYTLANVGKALITIGLGWLAHLLFLKKITLALPRAPEQLGHLIGAMSLVGVALFWGVLI